MDGSLATDVSFPRAGWHRASAYAVAWLAPLALMAWALPRYADRYKKLAEKGELPVVVHWSLAFVHLNLEYYWLPAAAAFVVAVVVAEGLRAGLVRARQERSSALAWRLGTVGVGLVAWLLALAPLIFSLTVKDRPWP